MEEDMVLREPTCHYLDYIGVPHDSSTWGCGVKVALIDGFSMDTQHHDHQFTCLERQPCHIQYFHDCDHGTTISEHGLACASVLAGRCKNVGLFNTSQEVQIRGIAPACDLYLYVAGCASCTTRKKFLLRALKQTILDSIDIVSISLATSDQGKPESEAETTLDAFRRGTLVCQAVGENGPKPESVVYGFPWCMNVGACDSGKILVTDIEVGLKGEVPKDLQVLETRGEFNIIDRLEGVSCNIHNQESFHKLWFSGADFSGKESLIFYHNPKKCNALYASSKQEFSVFCNQMEATLSPRAVIHRKDTNRLWDLQKRIPGSRDLYVRILTSRLRDDDRKPFVCEFSARGPSLFYREFIMPDVVAPGLTILISWPEGVQCFLNHYMKTGTSVAVSLVVGAAAFIKQNHPEWSPFAIKSALVTTARSFAAEGVPGNEFDYGAGMIQPMKAVETGLIYDECAENFEMFECGLKSAHELNMPSFAAGFSSWHEPCVRIFERELTCVVDIFDTITYEASWEVFSKSLDPALDIRVDPRTLSFKAKGDRQKFQLKVRVRPYPSGYVSALLRWKVSSGGPAGGLVDVCSPIHLYAENLYVKLKDEKK